MGHQALGMESRAGELSSWIAVDLMEPYKRMQRPHSLRYLFRSIVIHVVCFIPPSWHAPIPVYNYVKIEILNTQFGYLS